MKEGVNRQQIKKLLKIDYMIDNYLGIFQRNKIAQKPKLISPSHHQQTNPNIEQQKSVINIKRRPSSAKPSSQRNQSKTTYDVSNHKIPISKNRQQLILRKTTRQQTLPQSKQTMDGQSNQQQQKFFKPKAKMRTVSCRKISKKQKYLIKNRYEVIGVIGKGMSGSVYKAHDILSERIVAIKIISIQSKQYHYMKELQHPNIIEYYNSFVENNKRYLILQYFPFSLQTMIRRKKLSEKQTKDIFQEIVNAVVYLHGMSLAHRDIKLDNIVISEDLKIVKFIDFGLCIDTSQQLQRPQIPQQQFCGTANYLPPEIIKRNKYDAKKADIWSLGVLLYALSFGRHPFQGRDQNDTFLKIQTKKLIIPSTTPQNYRQLIHSMLQKNPDNRPSILDVLKSQWLKIK